MKRAVVDARVGAFVYDQRLASYAFAAKSYDAVWDSSLEGFRCPPGSGGGQVTNGFGREYGPAVTRRLVAEFDVDDTKILGRRFNRGTGERIGRTRRRAKPDNPVGAIGRTRNARVAAYDPNAVDADADLIVQEGTNQQRAATPGIVGRARDAVARGLERLGDVVEGDSGEDELPSRSAERAVSVDVARQKTPRTPSRVREATVRDELSVANKPVVEDSPSEVFVDAQEQLSALSDQAQRLLSDRRQSLNADDLARAAVLAVSRNTVIRPVVDFETFWDVNTRDFQGRLDEMEKLSADLNDMFKEFDFDSLSDEELETLSNSYNDIYDDLNERYDSNVMAFDLVKDDVRRGWEVAEGAEQRRADADQQRIDANAQAVADSQAEALRQIVNGTSNLPNGAIQDILYSEGVRAPSFDSQRRGEPISPEQQALLNANDASVLDVLLSRRGDARQVAGQWVHVGIPLDEHRIQIANANLDNLLQYWVRASGGDNPRYGMSLAGEQAARVYYDKAVALWEEALALNKPAEPLTEEAKSEIFRNANKLMAAMGVAQDELAKNPSQQSLSNFSSAETELRYFIGNLVSMEKHDDDTEFYDDTISQSRDDLFKYLKKNRDSIFRHKSDMLDKVQDIKFGGASDSYISREEFDLLKSRIFSLPSGSQLELLFLPDEEDMDEVTDHVDHLRLNRQSFADIERATVPSIRPDAPPGLMRPVVQIGRLSDGQQKEFIDEPGELIETLDSLSSLDTIIQDERAFNRTQRDLLANVKKLNKFAEERYDGGDFESFQKATNLIRESESYLSELGIARVEYLNEQDLEGFDVVEQRRRIDAAISIHLDVHDAYEQLVTIEDKAEFIINRVRDTRLSILADHVVERYGQTDAPWLDASYNPQNIDDFYRMYNAARSGGDQAAEDAMWRWAQSVWGHSVEDGSIPIRTKDGSLFKTVLDRSNAYTTIPNSFYGHIYKFNEDTNDWERVGHFNRTIGPQDSNGDDATYNAFMYMGTDAQIGTVFANEAKNSGFQSVFNPHSYMWLSAAGFKGTGVSPASDGYYVWPRLGFRPERDDYYQELATAMTNKLQDYRAGLDSIILNDAQAALVEFLINKSESLRHSHLSAPGLGEYLAVLEFSEINSTMTARERSQQMRNESFAHFTRGVFKYEGNVARDPRDLRGRARWEA